MRPRQWIKNLLVFAGLFYAGQFGAAEPTFRAVTAFLLFCALSGVVYVVNDIFDVEQDRNHPLKRLRPIASGQLSIPAAWVAAVIIGPGAVVLSFVLSIGFGLVALAYFSLMMAYSFGLKRIVIVDLLALAIGFVLRAFAGAVAVDVESTQWFLECILFLALFIAICKRRHELILLNDRAIEHRIVLREYSASFLDQMVSVSTAASILTYALWTTAPETQEKFDGMILTVPLVIFAIFRYLYLVYHRSEGGAPEVMFLTDRPLLIDLILWFLVVMILVYRENFVAILSLAGAG
jgi:4-hydroxybenzoate polyprenyltransferase